MAIQRWVDARTDITTEPEMIYLSRAIIGLLLIMSPVWAWAADTGGKPRAVFPEPRYEFTGAVEGLPVTHDFIVQNKGTAELRINNILTS